MEVSAEMKLTIGLVTMNRERQVAEAIQSCLQSNLPNETEFVVINNASTDNTETVVKSILDSSGFPYVYYKTESNIGAGGGEPFVLSNPRVSTSTVWMTMPL